MTASIHDVLDDLRASSLDERDKGDKFERLVHAYLKTDLEWAHRFSDVWRWSEWPGREERPDTGIDLAAANREAGEFTAIQCEILDSLPPLAIRPTRAADGDGASPDAAAVR